MHSGDGQLTLCKGVLEPAGTDVGRAVVEDNIALEVLELLAQKLAAAFCRNIRSNATERTGRHRISNKEHSCIAMQINCRSQFRESSRQKQTKLLYNRRTENNRREGHEMQTTNRKP